MNANILQDLMPEICADRRVIITVALFSMTWSGVCPIAKTNTLAQ
jgi:hypothetical protein